MPQALSTPLPAARREQTDTPGPGIHARGAPWVLVGAAVAWSLVSLRAETLGVPYLNDSAIHEQMVRFAARQFAGGHLPLTSWYPYLGLGSPQFLHYQSLPAMLTGLVGLAVGPNLAFRWSVYILVSAWPVTVYVSARWFGAGRWAAAASAAMSPFVLSVTGIGYEQPAYVWYGYGVWTQLWASLTLPLAWGCSWRAIRQGRGFCAAAALISLTMAFHFETGYLAIIPLLLWPFAAGRPVLTRVRRGAMLVCGSLLAGAWVIVPLLQQRAWAATNEILAGTPLVNGYGADRVLQWLVTGQLLDDGRIPVITLLAAIGLVLAGFRFTKDADARALVVALAACLLLSFGRTTFGGLADLLPGSGDVFFRRFMMGIQLAALLLAGTGAAWGAGLLWTAGDRWTTARRAAWPAATPRRGALWTIVAVAAMAVVLTPAWLQLNSYDRLDASTIRAQQSADDTHGAEVDRLLAIVRRDGGGRVYAGTPTNWGIDFTVGDVPVFKYLASRDIDEVGFALRTASLMTDPEYEFDESDPGDYLLFGIHYLLLPTGRFPPVAAHLVMRAGAYSLWTTETGGYVHVGSIVGLFAANRTDVGTLSIGLLHSALAQDGEYLRVLFDRTAGIARPPAPLPSRGDSVVSESDDLTAGEVTATVRMREPGVVVLSASFDPGWTATVDGGRPHTVEMVAPALVATDIPAGTHRIVFRYRGYGDYPQLFVLSGLSLLALLGAGLVRRRRAGGGGMTLHRPPRATAAE